MKNVPERIESGYTKLDINNSLKNNVIYLVQNLYDYSNHRIKMQKE